MATESYPPVLTEIAFISGFLLHLVQAVAPEGLSIPSRIIAGGELKHTVTRIVAL